MSFLRVRDERLNTSAISDTKYFVHEGPRTSYTILPPQNVNEQSLVYQLNNVGPNVGRNRQIWVNPQVTITLTGDFNDAVPTTGQLGLKAWPFNRNISQSQHTLNGATETYLTNQIIDFLARLKTDADCIQPYDNTQPDNCVDYNTGIANISPLVSYTSTLMGDVQHPRNIGITSVAVSGTSPNNTLTIQLNWWEPLITPFTAVADNVKNLPAIYAIDGETINLVFANQLSDILAYNSNIANGAIVQNVSLNSCSLYIEYITARDLMLPEVSTYQFPKYQRFQSQIGTLISFGQPGSVTVQVNAQTMPSKIVCFIRSPESDRSNDVPDFYCPITSMQVQLDNGTTLLNGASQHKLYDISRQNGLTDVFPVFAQYNLDGVNANDYYGSGSVVVLDPAKDLSISQEEGLTNCSSGKYTIQITMNYNAPAAGMVNATAYVFTINDAVLLRTGRTYVSKLLAYSREEVMNAKTDATFVERHELEDAKMSNLFLSGGSFKSFFRHAWRARHKIFNGAKDAIKLGKQGYDAYNKLRGRGDMGGYALGGDDGMRMYCE